MVLIEKHDAEFINLVNKYPEMKAKFEALLLIAQATETRKADDVEMQLTEELRKLGHDTFQAWAISQEQRQADYCLNDPTLKKHGKKKFIGTRHMA